METTTRVLLACTMKSGSSYVAEILSRYFGTESGNRDLPLHWEAEQNLSHESLSALGGRSSVLQMHLLPYAPNLRLCREYGFSILFQWRNLGDAIVSFDDHVRIFGERQPVCYIHDRQKYLALDDQSRYRFLIKVALPWYLGFYLAWRTTSPRFGVYERMVDDPYHFFSEFISDLGRTVDEFRLRQSITPPGDEARFNAGQVGRSAVLFDDATKRLLELTILGYVPNDTLDILLWELPWNVPALARKSDYDGTVVKTGDDARHFFVSRGIRRWIRNPNWLRSRWKLRDEPASTIARYRLDSIREGDPLP